MKLSESGFFFIRRFLATGSISLIDIGISMLFLLEWSLVIYIFQEITHFIFISLKLFMVLPHYSLISKIWSDVTSLILDIDNLCLRFFPVSVDSGLSILLIFSVNQLLVSMIFSLSLFPTSFIFTLNLLLFFCLFWFNLFF